MSYTALQYKVSAAPFVCILKVSLDHLSVLSLLSCSYLVYPFLMPPLPPFFSSPYQRAGADQCRSKLAKHLTTSSDVQWHVEIGCLRWPICRPKIVVTVFVVLMYVVSMDIMSSTVSFF